MTLAGVGIVVGVTGAMLASSALVTMLYGVSRVDALTYASVITLLVAVTAIACVLPAWRAARVQPSVALQAE
jgi:ABC-type antimicrobial peptide transport system permease subunit